MDAKSEFALFQLFKTEIWDLILIHLLLPSILIFAKLSLYPSKGSVRSGSEWNGRKYKTDGKFTTHWWINVYELFPQQLLSTFSSFSKTCHYFMSCHWPVATILLSLNIGDTLHCSFLSWWQHFVRDKLKSYLMWNNSMNSLSAVFQVGLHYFLFNSRLTLHFPIISTSSELSAIFFNPQF